MLRRRSTSARAGALLVLACAGALAVRLLAEMEGLTPTEVARIVRGLKDCVAVAAAVLEEQLDGDALLSLIRHGTLELIGATGLEGDKEEGEDCERERGSTHVCDGDGGLWDVIHRRARILPGRG